MKTQIMIALLAITLAACAPAQTAMPVSTTTFTSIVEMPTILPTYTPLPALPTFELLPTSTAPTALPTQTPLPAVLPKFPLDGYVMLFTKDGDLYFQDGNNSPVKLTHVGEKSYSPKLSDDNQKVVFTRGDGNEYSINTDGTQEQTIITKITNDWWTPFGPDINKVILDFVPGTHQLLFVTCLCESKTFRSPCSTSIFLADTDTGNIKKLADLGLSIQQNSVHRNIEVSPDGKMVAVGTMEGMNIFSLDGKIIRHSILPYKPSTSIMLFPSLYWLPDSSGLILALPNTIYHSGGDGDLPAHTIWRYKINDNMTVQIPLKIHPMLDTFQVSPDGNWIAYGGLPNDNSVYLGNLANGHIQTFGDAIQVYFSWGPGSKYFIATSAGSVLGAIDTPVLTLICQLRQWVDANHFTCWSSERISMAEIEAGGVKIYDLGFDKNVETAVFIKPK